MPVRPIMDPLSLRGLTARYLLALGLVAAFSISAYLALRATIRTQETAAAVVNVSGRQRMLSQRIALYAQRLVDATAQQRPQILTALTTASEEMARSHRDLLDGNPSRHLPGDPSADVHAMYFAPPLELDRRIATYLGHVAALTTTTPITKDDADLSAVMHLADGPLLTSLDAVVERYQRESEDEVALLLRAESLVAVLTLATLLAEAWFIFRPMMRGVVAERERLIESESRTRAVVDACHDAILAVGANGRIHSANPAAGKLFACSVEQLLGQRFDQLVDDRTWLDAVMARSVDHAAPERGVRSVEAKRHNGDTFTADLAVGSLRRGDERLAVVVLRQSTEQLQHYARSLERINRELDQFAYVTSHDLKAPLRAIANLSQWIEEDLTNAPPAVCEHLNLLRSRVRRLEALIEGIREYAATAGDAGDEETINLDQLAREAFGDQAHDRPFTLSITGELGEVHGDRTQLWQVLANLFANAVKHHHRDQGTVSITASGDGSERRITVSDDGPGIAPEHREKVFVIFQTLQSKDQGDGLGLGLALVKKIVEARGGEVAIDSAQQGGTAISFTWPDSTQVAA